ncbi:hypothetical protein H113_05428 [Trichophyton rubrum MR1459]|uniref:Uncharacterized protein n=2 Tax=Trichophyton TaxID=5550 RepID=A0A022VZE3_TRIRU|nr:hypothetical protein H100_05397 [Trichophyton rubrum MR850]EZF51309.1 hypothetical protein H103_05389 [Trichophyton rubrum CBS 288.86]EZF61884.1 hypothetical protein H104_05377 [Trichophyton rubrum CBS 289.86]EZF72515.1 hypothetical protein H105_05405 [Trichophyton soudanense CBS 452.61]EZF83204.1 hypothetical protein H110_05384 [Trichophyton rubrum MR1448]EZF93904.1 hypothetical protein H113_05428 [Trichophyton rubrum MR1459]EZG04978.1 hypothetical protein H106_05224 [Trichophyton rubrum 
MVSPAVPEIIEEDDALYSSIDARTESLQNLRELGPPDLVHLVKQSKSAANTQVRCAVPSSLQLSFKTTFFWAN